jgi:hypothetical protein
MEKYLPREKITVINPGKAAIRVVVINFNCKAVFITNYPKETECELYYVVAFLLLSTEQVISFQ